MSRIRLYKRRGEEGAALPMALAFLILCAVMTSIIIDYTGVGDRSATALGAERNNVYSVTSALDAAMKYVQTQPINVGANDDPNCSPTGPPTGFYTTNVNGQDVNVACTSLQNAAAGGTTLFPDFAILTTAAYHGGAAPLGNGNNPPGCVNEYSNELGIVQVQNSKLLQVEGNVYVNSDVDSDIWSGGCPLQTTAQHIKVENGVVLQRESLHDIDACPSLHDHVTDCNGANNNNYLPDPLAPADKAALTDPQLSPDATVRAQWQPNFSNPPAPGVIRDGEDNIITNTGCPATDPGSDYRLIKFYPGTYRDVSVLNAFTNGGCPNAVLWFKSGDYYFDFTDSGTASSTLHQWTINDTGVRIIGGQPFGGPDDTPVPVSQTWKPLTATSTASGSGSAAFNNLPAGATGIENNLTTATVANNGTASLTLSGFHNTASTNIPPDAQIDSVRLRIAHGEGNTALLKAPTVTITPAGGSPCTAVAVNPRAGAPAEDPSPNYNVFTISGTECLNDVSRINSTTKITYSVSHCTGTANGCTTATTTDSVDSIWFNLTYTTGGRLSWNPNDPSTITPSAPTVPGGCLSDKDESLGWSDGVEFVMGGDSHIELKSGKVELCNQRSINHQEMVIYGVPSRSATPVGPTAWTPFLTGTNNGFTNPDSGRIIGGSAATATLNTNGARTLQMTEFSPTSPASWPIGSADQIPAGSKINSVTLSVAHGEGVTTTGRNPTSGNVNTPTVTVTPADGGAACGPFSLTKRNTIGTDQITGLATCLTTAAALNGGVNITYSVSRAASATVNESLDGMSLAVTYTPPASATSGSLTPQTGCVTQTPYYSPTDHSPAYNGACALIQVAPTTVPANPSIDGSFPRVLALWGTAYAPSAAFDVPVDVMTTPVFDRGVVARMLMLGYNVSNNAIVPITSTPAAAVIKSNRDMVLIASSGSASVRAEVKVCDVVDADPSAPGACVLGDDSIGGTDPTVKVLSWKVTR